MLHDSVRAAIKKELNAMGYAMGGILEKRFLRVAAAQHAVDVVAVDDWRKAAIGFVEHQAASNIQIDVSENDPSKPDRMA